MRSAAALREPSLGPVFGMKGGGAGGGAAEVVPMMDINMHFNVIPGEYDVMAGGSSDQTISLPIELVQR